MQLAFIRLALELAETESMDSLHSKLEASDEKARIVHEIVLSRPNYVLFFESKEYVFRRVAQLFDEKCAAQYSKCGQILDFDSERGKILQDVIEPMVEQNWHLANAVQLLWAGVLDLSELWGGIEHGDIGSRYCIFRIAKMCKVEIPPRKRRGYTQSVSYDFSTKTSQTH